MSRLIYLVDAFAHAPFTGNPAGVCPLKIEPEESWMQNVAMEMNQAETAFFWPEGEGYRLRWFTPTVEVDLCGHATLASAHVLFSEAPRTEVRFFTRSGELVCKQVEDGIEMDFPSEEPSPVDPFPVAKVLGCEPVWTGANRMDWFFVLSGEEEVLSLKPDLGAITDLGKRGVIVTAQTSSAPKRFEADFVSRFFAPQSGVSEDSVTGSAHCALGPFWAARQGKPSIVGYQASKRGGYVKINVRGDRVGLTGQARTILVGELT